MPAADERVNTVTRVTSAMYGRIDSHAFQNAMPASDQVVAATPAAAGATPARLPATRLLTATVTSDMAIPSAVSATSVKSFAARYVQRPVPCDRTDRSVP